MEARREKILQYFNQVGNELLRTGTTVTLNLDDEDTAAAEAPEDFPLPEIVAPVAELDLSPEAIAAARSKTRPDAPAAAEAPRPAAGDGFDAAGPAGEEPLAPAREVTPASAQACAPRAFTLADADDAEPAPAPGGFPFAEAEPGPAVPAADAAPAPDDAWKDLTLDPAPRPDPAASPADLWPDLGAEPATAATAPWPDLDDTLPAGTPPAAAAESAAVPADTLWQDIGFDDSAPATPPASAGTGLWQDLAPAAPDAFMALAPAEEPDLWQDLGPLPDAEQAAPADEMPAAPRQTAPGLTEVPGAIFSSPIVHQPAPAPDTPAPSGAPRAPLLPGQEPENAEDEDTLSGLVAKPADPAAGAAWQRRHKAIRAVQALRRLYR